MSDLTIGEIARRAGINTSTLRYYERIGLLPRPKRVNRHRRYDSAVLQHLAVIRFAQDAGYTLAEIETLLYGFEAGTPPSARWQALAVQKLPEIDAIIERAQTMKKMLEHSLTCQCPSLDDCGTINEKQDSTD